MKSILSRGNYKLEKYNSDLNYDGEKNIENRSSKLENHTKGIER